MNFLFSRRGRRERGGAARLRGWAHSLRPPCDRCDATILMDRCLFNELTAERGDMSKQTRYSLTLIYSYFLTPSLRRSFPPIVVCNKSRQLLAVIFSCFSWITRHENTRIGFFNVYKYVTLMWSKIATLQNQIHNIYPTYDIYLPNSIPFTNPLKYLPAIPKSPRSDNYPTVTILSWYEK